MDSPSRQLLEEQLSRLRLVDREFCEQLDKEEREARERHHRDLDAAKADHERVRKRAELEAEHWVIEQEGKRRREIEEAEAKLRVQREREVAEEMRRRREIEERERRERERREREDAERSAREDADRRAREEALRRAKEEAERKAREEAERKAKDEAAKEAAAQKAKEDAAAAAVAKLQQQQQSPSSAAPAAPSAQPHATGAASALAASATNKEAVHREYLELHRCLKEFRQLVKRQGLEDKEFKNLVFEGRMEIKKRVGQIRGVKGGHKEPVTLILNALTNAVSRTNQGFDVRKLVLSSSPLAQQPQPVPMSTLFLYMLHIFGKCVVQQFIREGSSNPKIADSIGIAAITIYSDQKLKCGDVALVDMLIAKFHKLCPVLFGIYGDERTPQGRERLGWRDTDDRQTFTGIVSGLSAGYGALTLRNLTNLRVKRDNPLPNSMYWLAVSRIVNTPPAEVTEIHLIALKALIENNVEKFIKLYGQMAKVVLRHALVVFPQAFEKRYPIAAGALKVLPEVMRKELHLTI